MRMLALLVFALLPVGFASAAPVESPLALFTGPSADGGSDVVVQHVDGSGRVSLTGGLGFAVAPAWSPDGASVAFASSLATRGTGEVEIYVVNADGSDRGNDTVIARGGRDVIHGRDGMRDWIDCGTEYDIAIVDRVDHTSRCEKVVRR